jgi:tRNA(fMet)-specific endonuclease VapC
LNYLLDTNAAIAILTNREPSVRLRLRRAVTRDAAVGISSIVLHELWYGVARSVRKEENAERLRIFLAGGIAVVEFDEEDAAAAGELRGRLADAGTPIGPYDVLIAAHAMRREAILVSSNVSEFRRVKSLRLEDWAAR